MIVLRGLNSCKHKEFLLKCGICLGLFFAASRVEGKENFHNLQLRAFYQDSITAGSTGMIKVQCHYYRSYLCIIYTSIPLPS